MPTLFSFKFNNIMVFYLKKVGPTQKVVCEVLVPVFEHNRWQVFWGDKFHLLVI